MTNSTSEAVTRIVRSALDRSQYSVNPLAVKEAVGLLQPLPAESVDATLLRLGVNAVEQRWSHGWQPTDLAHVVKRHLDGVHADLLRTWLAEEAKSYRNHAFADRVWLNQLHALEADVWWSEGEAVLTQWQHRSQLERSAALRCALELLVELERLLPITELRTPPRFWSAATVSARNREPSVIGEEAEKVLTRVRALLAKAESTTFSDEADALTAKAQQLMSRHSIDDAMVHHAQDGSDFAPDSRRIPVEDPYGKAKASLLAVVANANTCRVIYSPDTGLCAVFGFEADLETTELLYTSLLLQATRAMLAAGSTKDAAGRSTTRSFRNSFMIAFANRMRVRLSAARQAAQADASTEYSSNLLPVLASREKAVINAVASAFPDSTHMKHSISNYAGYQAGSAAADRSSLLIRSEVE